MRFATARIVTDLVEEAQKFDAQLSADFSPKERRQILTLLSTLAKM